MKLERPTRLGRSIMTKTIKAKKDEIVNACNDFIFERANKENFIKVMLFTTVIYNYKNIPVNKWNYKPTYQ